MALKRFVGFGLGPIQSGLMLAEAARSGSFGSYVVAEVDQELVDAVRTNGNRLTVNVARKDGLATETLADLIVLNPAVASDRNRLGEEISRADELATAVPSVDLYTAGGDNSIAALLAANVNPARPQLLYACENNNYAAEILLEQLRKRAPESRLAHLQILNTVIGKMSGVHRDPTVIRTLGLSPITPSLPRAVLVEEFNRILVSRVTLPGVRKGIDVFSEKDDLLPFEEAKLFGHNAIHALLGYLAWARGLVVMSDIRKHPDLYETGRRAFLDESGATLIRKHGHLGDQLFTPDGWRAYAEDLLERMTNPYLHDAVDRICRDPARKLAYGDRLVGTMRECLKQGVEPELLAAGAAAALRYLAAEDVGKGTAWSGDMRAKLLALWEKEPDDGVRERCLAAVLGALPDSQVR